MCHFVYQYVRNLRHIKHDKFLIFNANQLIPRQVTKCSEWTVRCSPVKLQYGTILLIAIPE